MAGRKSKVQALMDEQYSLRSAHPRQRDARTKGLRTDTDEAHTSRVSHHCTLLCS